MPLFLKRLIRACLLSFTIKLAAVVILNETSMNFSSSDLNLDSSHTNRLNYLTQQNTQNIDLGCFAAFIYFHPPST